LAENPYENKDAGRLAAKGREKGRRERKRERERERERERQKSVVRDRATFVTLLGGEGRRGAVPSHRHPTPPARFVEYIRSLIYFDLRSSPTVSAAPT